MFKKKIIKNSTFFIFYNYKDPIYFNFKIKKRIKYFIFFNKKLLNSKYIYV